MPDAHQRHRPQPGEEREDDVVADLRAVGVSGRPRRRCRRPRGRRAIGQMPTGMSPGGDVVVGVAQAGGHHLDLDLALARVVEVELDDLVGAQVLR